MTVRNLIRQLLEHEQDLNREVMVRVVRRDDWGPPGEVGSVSEVKLVPVDRLHSGNLVMEHAALTHTPWDANLP